jgi:hypothetical protein
VTLLSALLGRYSDPYGVATPGLYPPGAGNHHPVIALDWEILRYVFGERDDWWWCTWTRGFAFEGELLYLKSMPFPGSFRGFSMSDRAKHKKGRQCNCGVDVRLRRWP